MFSKLPILCWADECMRDNGIDLRGYGIEQLNLKQFLETPHIRYDKILVGVIKIQKVHSLL